MRFDKTVLLTAILALSTSLSVRAQAQPHAQTIFGTAPGQVPVLETSLGYTFIHANAPPGQCGCFSASGGFGSAVVNTVHGFSIVADLNAIHAANIGGTTQSLTVFNYLFGPRYSMRTLSKRFTPYGQALGGRSQEFSSYPAVQNVQGLAFSLGGGVSTVLKPHLGWTIVEADWIQSRLPNAQNNLQNDIRVSTALTFRLGPR
jgi:outer membrane immunogenic protein